MSENRLIVVVDSIGGLKIEIWSNDLEHAKTGHPEASLERVQGTLKDPSRIVQSKSSSNTCLFYSVEIKVSETESLFFCVVVGVSSPGKGRMITAYDADFMKTGKELYSKGGKSES